MAVKFVKEVPFDTYVTGHAYSGVFSKRNPITSVTITQGDASFSFTVEEVPTLIAALQKAVENVNVKVAKFASKVSEGEDK